MAYWEHLQPNDYPEAINLELRSADKKEVEAATGSSNYKLVLAESIKVSDVCCVIKNDDNKIIGVFGVGSADVKGQGYPWLLGSDDLLKHSKEFLSESRSFINELRNHYAQLVNWVSAQNTESMRWLKWLGFTIVEEEDYLVDPAVPFHQFYMYGREFDHV